MVGPAGLDDDVAGRRDGFGGGGGRRIQVRQQQDNGDEAAQGQHDDIAENRAALVLFEEQIK